MSSSTNNGSIRVGCVPEHFSAPLLHAVESGEFAAGEIELMVKKLCAGELDVAICVTEGLVAGVNKNKDLCLFGTYVDTPLPWAVSVATDAAYSTVDDLAFGATFGISRPGSGSEVMARYAASKYEWANQPKFAVLGDVHGLVEGVQQGQADAFMWERTTMQRHYAANQVRYLGTVRPPWPAFSYGARSEYVQANAARVKELVAKICRVTGAFMAAEKNEEALAYVCRELGYQRADAEQWKGYVGFSADGSVDDERVGAAIRALTRAGVVEDCSISDVVVRP
ncbi:hypothetical protein GGI07_001919 [Coemansia sp. Benny D115]|nr:hypothetical protein GGI07_001919 [Coemansia sp. Benny D115]